MSMSALRLSVVVITKNQAWNIGRLLTSVIEETRSLPAVEIILVDSASTDATVQEAQAYPITILRLHAGQHMNAAAGRYIGARHATGDLVLFLDGDMELYSGWLKLALELLERNATIGAITGGLIDRPIDTRERGLRGIHADDDRFFDVQFGGGATLYRRAVLDQVGSFNPFLFSDEEPDLCLRIRHAGFRVVQTFWPIAYHYSHPPGRYGTIYRRWRRKLFLGAGQNLRYYRGTDLFWPYVRERGYGLLPGAAFLIGLLLLGFSMITRRWQWFGIWTLGAASVVGLDALRKRSLYRSLASVLERIFILDGTVRGFLMAPRAPSSYNPRFDVVQAYVVERTRE
mgnify:CR=1 FL=1